MRAKSVLHSIKADVEEKKQSHTKHDFSKDKPKEEPVKEKAELTHQEKEDAIVEAVKKAPKIGFDKVFDSVKDIHQSTLPKKEMLKDVLGTIRDKMNDKDHIIKEEVDSKDILDH